MARIFNVDSSSLDIVLNEFFMYCLKWERLGCEGLGKDVVSPYLLRSPRSLEEIMQRRQARQKAFVRASGEAPGERAPRHPAKETAAELRQRGIELRPRVVWVNRDPTRSRSR